MLAFFICYNKAMKEKINLVLKCVALGMGVAVVTLSILNKLDTQTAFTLLGIGLAAIAIAQIDDKDQSKKK